MGICLIIAAVLGTVLKDAKIGVRERGKIGNTICLRASIAVGETMTVTTLTKENI